MQSRGLRPDPGPNRQVMVGLLVIKADEVAATILEDAWLPRTPSFTSKTSTSVYEARGLSWSPTKTFGHAFPHPKLLTFVTGARYLS
jgi:hypothetical protein